MRSIKIFIILFFFSFSIYAQNANTPKSTAKVKTEKKYIDLEELRDMKVKGATQEEITARYNEMIDAIDHDFHGVPLKKTTKESVIGKANTKSVKTIKPLSL